MEALWPILKIKNAFGYAKENGKAIHFMGLTSNGGVHSSLEHLFALCDIAKEYGLEKYLSTVSWTAVIPTLEAEKALSSRLPSIVQSLSAQ